MSYRVVAPSSGDKERDFARKLGDHDYIDTSKDDLSRQLQEMGGAALVVCTAPNPKAIGPLLVSRLVESSWLALCGPIEVKFIDLITKAVSVTGFPSGHALDSEEAIAFTKLYGIICMVEMFPLKDVQKALITC
jgi:D-arabinose 1-dehydrogenase-like Zn-dependent alcohol dehydrogenase